MYIIYSINFKANVVKLIITIIDIYIIYEHIFL